MQIDSRCLAGLLIAMPLVCGGQTLDCAQGPELQFELQELTTLAIEELSEELWAQGFESVKSSACTTHYPPGTYDEPAAFSVKEVQFQGFLPYMVVEEDFRQRLAVMCQKTVDSRPGRRHGTHSDCAVVRRGYLTDPDVDGEILLRGEFTKESVQAFLALLKQTVKEGSAPDYVMADTLRYLRVVDVSSRGGRSTFTARIMPGDASIIVTSRGTVAEVLLLGEPEFQWFKHRRDQ